MRVVDDGRNSPAERCGVTFSIPAASITSHKSRRMLFVVCGVLTRALKTSASASVSPLRSRRERIGCDANDGNATRRTERSVFG